MFESAKRLWNYRFMIASLVRREIRGRYKGSVLGFLWNFITPLMQIFVYIMVFSIIFRPSIPHYEFYLTAGMVAWIFFSESVSDGSGIIVSNSHMIKKIYFPRSVLPISSVLAKMVNFFIMIGIAFIIFAVTGFGFDGVALLALVPTILIYLVFLIGMALLLSALDVYFRDIQYIVSVILMVLIWMTPIMYVRSDYSDALLNTVLKLNPMTYFIEMFQSVLYWKVVPSLSSFLICGGIAIVSLIVGMIVFRRLEKNFAEVL